VPLHGGRSVTVDFLGHPAAFPQGPWLLAGLLKCPINLMLCLKKPTGDYRLTLEPFADAVVWKRSDREQVIHQWASRYAERLGHYCLEAPRQWFNFYPFWKTDDDANA
jgi:predicted LPLAT superfamily acyltransferase